MKTALVYDRVNTFGGAERVLGVLHELFPQAPLYTSVYNSQKAKWAENIEIKSSFLQYFPFARSSHELYPLLMPIAFESFDFSSYDLVISITSEAAKGIITGPKTLHICYCLTPIRYLWSGYNEYFHNLLFRLLTLPFVGYLRFWDKIAANRPDYYIAISKTVQKRIELYYKKSAKIIYPPFIPLSAEDKEEEEELEEEDFFLVVSRLVPYKRVDIAIAACNVLHKNLYIVGTGREEEKLKKIAGRTIKFLGNLTDQSLAGYYKKCQALLFTSNEDFGLTSLEAQHFGKPVIAYRGGGALETIIENKTGIFFDEQTPGSLQKVLENFSPLMYNSSDCEKQSAGFEKDIFKKEFLETIKKLIKERKTL